MREMKSRWRQHNEIRSVMETSGEMNWKVKAMSEIILWVSMMKGTVDKSIMNENYDEGRKWNEIWYGCHGNWTQLCSEVDAV